jgi:allophanate hydrolase subunit 2
MADCPPTGGYNKIAVLSPTALPLLAQCVPGLSRVRFTLTSSSEALTQLQTQSAILKKLSIERG